MKKIQFVKLFRRVVEGETYAGSIVAYKKSVWEINGINPTKHRHKLYINLWIVELFFDWITAVVSPHPTGGNTE
jgi:hypothetical protein